MPHPPVPLRVRLPFASEAEFAERFGPNVTRGGVFIPTRALKPEGTTLRFELVLADGSRLLRGEAVVVRAQGDEAGARSGMMLRFVRLDGASQAWLEQFLSAREAPGRSGAPGGPPAPGPAAPAPVEAPRAAPAVPEPAPAAPPRAAPTPAEPAPAGPSRPVVAPAAGAPAPSHPAGLIPRATRRPAPEPGPGPTPATPGALVPGPDASPATRAAPLPVASEPARAEEGRPAREGRGEAREGRARTPLPGSLSPLTPTRRPEAEPVLGVDLGTSYARVAVFRQGAVELLTPADGTTPGIPSLVALEGEHAVAVGEAALVHRARHPERVATGVKRLLGRRGRSARMLEHALQSISPVLTDTRGHAGFRLGAKDVGAVELAAHLLRELAERASRQLGEPVRRAVLCVPAYFTDAQRGALLEAGRRAGLTVLRLLSEPSAAALAFGHGRALARKRLLVYDLGGGTFDVSVVEVTGDDVDVVSTGGDNFLGGIDFDARVDYELRRRMAEAGLTPPEPATPGGQRLREEAERAKCALGVQDEVEVALPGVAREASGARADFTTRLSRARLEELTADLVERTLEVTQEVLAAAAIAPQSLDEVLLLGGQSRSPHVRRRLEEALGRPVRAEADMEGMVARGAALLGHALVRAAQGKGPVVLSELLSTPLGIGERGGTFRRVLERNTRLPADKTLGLPARAGEPLTLALYQGSAPLVEDDEFLGAATLTPERDGEVLVHFSLSADGTLSLGVTPPGGRRAPVLLDVLEPDEAGRAQLLAAAPEGETPPASATGLLGGLRRLFGRR